jgi:hypothetical protein
MSMIGITIGIWASGINAALPYGLVADGYGGWTWVRSGPYGLSDDGSGGWEWTTDPDYRLSPSSNSWE